MEVLPTAREKDALPEIIMLADIAQFIISENGQKLRDFLK